MTDAGNFVQGLYNHENDESSNQEIDYFGDKIADQNAGTNGNYPAQFS